MADSRKTVPAEKADARSDSYRYKGWDMSRVFWGLLLVLVGSLVLLDNLGVVTVQYENIWLLWPLLIVGWGVSLLNIKGSWWSVVSVLMMVASFGLIAWAAVGGVPLKEIETDAQTQRIEKIGGEVERLDVTVNAGAGKLVIGSHKSDVPVEAVLRSDFATLNFDSSAAGTTQKVNVSTVGGRTWWVGNMRSELDIQLARDLPTYLTLQTGASDLNADLAQLKLERLDIDSGASRSTITLGNLVDLVDVKLSAGASSITLRVPEGSGVRVKLDKGVSSMNLNGLREVAEGQYESTDFDTASKKITIRGDLGVTSFALERY